MSITTAHTWTFRCDVCDATHAVAPDRMADYAIPAGWSRLSVRRPRAAGLGGPPALIEGHVCSPGCAQAFVARTYQPMVAIPVGDFLTCVGPGCDQKAPVGDPGWSFACPDHVGYLLAVDGDES